MGKINVTILTEKRFVDPVAETSFVRNLLREDNLVREALEKKGLSVERCSWDDPMVDWSGTEFILFRSTWDYFERYREFSDWLEKVKTETRMLNPYELIRWNLDKHYLQVLGNAGIHIPATVFIERGDAARLSDWVDGTGWREVILKPVISGAARHTYRFRPSESEAFEKIFQQLIGEESMMIQEFQDQVPEKGEVAFMVIGGTFSHAIIKKAKKGDFRVQDEFGGTVHHYHPSRAEISFAEEVVDCCGNMEVYARVDAIWDNQNRMAVSELELIEPELWFRFLPEAADRLADAIVNRYYS